jgi:hypothetical protein
VNLADVWLTSNAPNPQQGNTEVRGMDTARLIDARPSMVVFSRLVNGRTVQLPPQRVRLEVIQNIRGANEQRDALLATTKQYVVIIGIVDHPTIPDTNLLRSDQFFFNDRMWECIEFIDTIPGRLMVSAELLP